MFVWLFGLVLVFLLIQLLWGHLYSIRKPNILFGLPSSTLPNSYFALSFMPYPVGDKNRHLFVCYSLGKAYTTALRHLAHRQSAHKHPHPVGIAVLSSPHHETPGGKPILMELCLQDGEEWQPRGECFVYTAGTKQLLLHIKTRCSVMTGNVMLSHDSS